MEVDEKRLEFAKSLEHAEPENVIDDDCIIGYMTVIGTDGFGYVREEDGKLFKMPHTGNVIIESNVEIGNNTCIDRAVIGSTVIGAGTKIDNLVHIAHGVKIGKNCLITAGAIVGGSCEVGDDCYIGIGALIKNKVKIGKGATIGMGAVILKDVPEGETWIGNPGRKL